MWVFALPLFLHMDYVLTLWLKNPPENAVFFTRLALIESLINATALPLMTAARAQGKMAGYELSLGSVNLLIFVVDWILLKLGFEAWVVFIVAAGGNALMYLLRIIFVKRFIGLKIGVFITRVLLPVILIAVVSSIPSLYISRLLPNKFWFVALSVFFSVCVTTFAMFFIGMEKVTRKKVLQVARNKIPNFRNKGEQK